jgi:hypothetical protein
MRKLVKIIRTLLPAANRMDQITMRKDVVKTLKQTVDKAKEIKGTHENLGAILKENRFLVENENTIQDAIKKLIRPEQNALPLNNDAFPVDQVHDYFSQANTLVEKVLTLAEEIDYNDHWDVRKEVNSRKAARRDMWWLWLQKLSRWSLGIFAAVFLYSILVAIADSWDFLHVPIRDLILMMKGAQ